MPAVVHEFTLDQLALTLGEAAEVKQLVEETYRRTGNTFTTRWLKGEQPFP